MQNAHFLVRTAGLASIAALVPALLAPSLLLRAAQQEDSSTTKSGSGQMVEWRYYGGDAASTKYSPLDQINKDNVKNLKIAWRWKAENFGARPEFNLEATPLMIGGALYSSVGTRRDVVSIDAATGETLWMFRYDEGERGRVAPRQNHRGV